MLHNKIIQDVKTAFSPDRSLLNFCSAATNGRNAADASISTAASLHRSVYQLSNSTWTELNHPTVALDIKGGIQNVSQSLSSVGTL